WATRKTRTTEGVFDPMRSIEDEAQSAASPQGRQRIGAMAISPLGRRVRHQEIKPYKSSVCYSLRSGLSSVRKLTFCAQL
ncbi:MAG: hypothetical protein ACN4EJ_06575, partial [Porticoccaceae bacterium]